MTVMLIGLIILNVVTALVGISAIRKTRRIAKASVLRRIEVQTTCRERHCRCVT
jgi:hypothetical protein